MAKQTIGLGSVANDGNGDDLRTGGDKINDNFNELYTALGDGTTLGLTAAITSAGALMDSEVTDLAGIKGVTVSTLQVKPAEGAFVDGDKTKLDGIAASANNYSHPNHTGDVTSTGDGSTVIANNAVTNAKLAQVPEASIKGRISELTGDVEDLDADDVTSMLNVFTSTLKGLVPASGGGTVNYLRADGTFAEPPGSAGTPEAQLTVYNGTGSTIAKGVPVYISGFDATSGNVSVTTADADGSGTMPAIGVTRESIANAASGQVTLHGEVTGIDTSSTAINDPLYVSTSGALSTTPPATGIVQRVGFVTRVDAVNGEMLVAIGIEGRPLNDNSALEDVNDNEVIQFGVTASAVNHIKVTNSATGNSPIIEAVGGDTNIDINLVTKGTGRTVIERPQATHVINAQTGTTYTLALADQDAVVTMSNASANTLTIPANATTAIPIGTKVEVWQLGAGVTTIEGATGVTLQGNGGSVSAGSCDIQTRYGGATLTKIDTNTWMVGGDIDTVA